jgi:hypothetical protein
VNGVDILTMQLIGSCNLVAAQAEEAAPCWDQRAFAKASLPGFVEWHCARIIDWGVNTVVRNVPELASQPQWRDRVRYEMGHGAGLSDLDADDIAATVAARDVTEYALSLSDGIASWLDATEASELDQVPDLRARNQDHPRYRTPTAWEEIKNLQGIPAWQFLGHACIAHIRVHSGQVDALTQLLRSQLLPA